MESFYVRYQRGIPRAEFGVRVPVLVVEELDRIAEETGRKRNSLVNDALALFLSVKKSEQSTKNPAA